jgi:hypothetical protein
LQKTFRIARQYWRTSTLREALAQPFHCDLHRLQNTKELQHTTVEHIACTKCLNTCKTQKHSINKKEKKSPGTLSYIAPTVRDSSGRNRRQSADARNRRAREPTFLRSGTSV